MAGVHARCGTSMTVYRYVMSYEVVTCSRRTWMKVERWEVTMGVLMK